MEPIQLNSEQLLSQYLDLPSVKASLALADRMAAYSHSRPTRDAMVGYVLRNYGCGYEAFKAAYRDMFN